MKTNLRVRDQRDGFHVRPDAASHVPHRLQRVYLNMQLRQRSFEEGCKFLAVACVLDLEEVHDPDSGSGGWGALLATATDLSG